MPRRRIAPEEEARHIAPCDDEMPRAAAERGIAISSKPAPPPRRGGRDRDKLGDPARDEDEAASARRRRRGS